MRWKIFFFKFTVVVGSNDQYATMRAITVSLFGFLLAIASTGVSFRDGNSSVLCIESERQALLRFKQDLIDPSNRLSSWVEGGDCCKWIGVFCHNLTGHVNELHLASLSKSPAYDAPHAEWEAYHRSKLGGKINHSLLDLKHLSFLDLSNNNFSSIPIPEFIGLMGSLTYLNLSQAQFQGAIPRELGNLSRLHYLDLRGNAGLDEAKNLQWVYSLSSLQYLGLSDLDLSKTTDWLQVPNKLPFLSELHLSNCNLEDIPSAISVNSTNLLAVLDLSRNNFYSVPSWMFSLHGLVSIDLSQNSLDGPIPDDFRNISFLEVLDLSENELNSSMPHSLYGLNHLQFLSLRSNHFQGKISNVIGNLSSLIHLDLSDNMLEGTVSTSLEHLCNLKEIDLSSNKIDQEVSQILRSLSKCSLDRLESLNMANNRLSGPIPFSIGELSALKFFDVSDNQLNGTVPQSFGQLANLETLSFENNLIEGVVSEMHFSNLKRLRILKASGNLLRFKPNPRWVPPFHCESIELGYWHLGPQFPQWLKFQKNLFDLDISQAGISDVIPTWFWTLSSQFEYLNLSHNQLIGGISYLPVRDIVDLSWNQFTGPLPRVSPTLISLFLSNNFFSGSLSHFICNSSSEQMMILQVDRNLLSGVIPDCWKHWINLWFLNLGNNNLSGKIPFSLGYTGLQALILRNNSLFGELPYTLRNCTNLSLLDLSKNQFSGTIPAWIGGTLCAIQVLNLRSNNFHGHIPDKICDLNTVQYLDLGHNNISGAIPKCFGNLSAMATKNRIASYSNMWMLKRGGKTYYSGALLVMKGREYEYSTTLGLVTGIDLSANSLTGEILEELGSLIGLLSLNLSGNLLTGKIPERIGNMESLESLDLSMNRLHGEIPSSLSNLSFLNHLNLSYNNLTGQIPSGTQLQSFDIFSYIGNHLCGPPVTKNCSTNGETPDVTNGGSKEERNGSKVNGLYVSIVLGFVMGFWGVVAPLFLIRSWRFAYYKKLEHIGNKLYVFWATIGM